MWIFDATPLIYLTKVDRLELVQHLEERCVIPELVHDEVVETGLEELLLVERPISFSNPQNRVRSMQRKHEALSTR
jgi:predicted nucleic acid-binding protein